MRKQMMTVCYCALAVVLPAAASAAILRYEPFDYEDVGSTLQGKSPDGEETWLRAGVADPPSNITVGGGNLAVPFPLLPAIGNSGRITGVGNGSGAANRLGLTPPGSPITSGTVYYSLAFRADSLEGSNTNLGGFLIGLNNSLGSQTGNPGVVTARLQARIDPDDASRYQLGIIRNRSATAADIPWSSPLDVGETLFLVAGYDRTNDRAHLWINPDPNTFGDDSLVPPPTLTDIIGSGTPTNIASILLRQSAAPHLSLDELRVGTSWAAVTPVIPEPASLMLLLIGGAAICWQRRIVCR